MTDLSRKDIFAAHAISGLLANPNVLNHGHNAGLSLVNCAPSQIADYEIHIGDQMEHWAKKRDEAVAVINEGE